MTLNLPKRRGSTKRSSLPDARQARREYALRFLRRVCKPASGRSCPDAQSTALWPGSAVCFAFEDFRPDFFGTGEDAPSPSSRSNTMCFPTRRTPAIRLDSSVATISDAADLSGSGLDPSHTDSMTSPVTRLAKPRAMVSTSGSSGMRLVYRLGAGCRLQASAFRERTRCGLKFETNP